MNLGPHAFFIAAAYGATVIIVAGLILSAVLDYRAQMRALAELEARGVTRRSQDLSPGFKREAAALESPGAGEWPSTTTS
jgi:heme exporter protein D